MILKILLAAITLRLTVDLCRHLHFATLPMVENLPTVETMGYGQDGQNVTVLPVDC